MTTLCDVIDNCTECPRYGDDCDGDKRVEHTDLISRADAIAYIDKIINSGLGRNKSLDYIHKYISALPSADAVSREEAIQAIDRCRERKNKEIEQLREFYSQKPTIPMFAESEEAYKAWTGEEMGKTGDEINEMNKEIIKDILKMMPTAYLLEALGVSTFEELAERR
ncbi:MAG: hypothetical protein IIZ94_14440 [Prevotella sp.]|nr:hypothetical protein [Prevotella sp.]